MPRLSFCFQKENRFEKNIQRWRAFDGIRDRSIPRNKFTKKSESSVAEGKRDVEDERAEIRARQMETTTRGNQVMRPCMEEGLTSVLNGSWRPTEVMNGRQTHRNEQRDRICKEGERLGYIYEGDREERRQLNSIEECKIDLGFPINRFFLVK